METNFVIRFGGLMAVISGLFLASAHTIDLVAGGGNGTAIGKEIVFWAHLLIVFGIFGLHAAQGTRNGLLGSGGMILSVIGTIIVTAVVFVERAMISGVKVDGVFKAGMNQYIFSFGPLLFVIGMILFGASVLKNKILSRLGGIFLLIGTVVFSAGTLVSNAEAIITTIGAIFTGAGLIWLGLPLFQKKEKINTVEGIEQTR